MIRSVFFVCKQKTAYEMRISDWSSDVCSSDLVCDWCLDDQPVPLKATSGNISSIPYSVEINDVVISAVQQHRSDDIFVRGRDHFDRLYQEGAAAPRVMAITIHPYLTGVPHRIKYLEDLYDHILGHEDVVIARNSVV